MNQFSFILGFQVKYIYVTYLHYMLDNNDLTGLGLTVGSNKYLSDQLTFVQVVIDGYSAPLTAGNFAKLVRYLNLPLANLLFTP